MYPLDGGAPFILRNEKGEPCKRQIEQIFEFVEFRHFKEDNNSIGEYFLEYIHKQVEEYFKNM